MKIKKITLAMMVLSVGIICNSIYAATPHNIWYFGGKVGYSKYYNTEYKKVTNSNKSEDSILGAGLFLGYQFNPYLALEIGYDKLGQLRYKKENEIINYLDIHGAQLAAKFTLPLSFLSDNITLYGKAGAFLYSSSWHNGKNIDVKNGISPLFSGGVSYAINDVLESRLEYQWIHKIKNAGQTTPHNGLISVGLVYKPDWSKSHDSQKISADDKKTLDKVREQKATIKVNQEQEQNVAKYVGNKKENRPTREQMEVALQKISNKSANRTETLAEKKGSFNSQHQTKIALLNSTSQKLKDDNVQELTADEIYFITKEIQLDPKSNVTLLNSALRKLVNNNGNDLTHEEREMLSYKLQKELELLTKIQNDQIQLKNINQNSDEFYSKKEQTNRIAQTDNALLFSNVNKNTNNAKALTSDERALLAKISQDHRDSQTDNTVLNSALRKIADNNAKALTSDERALLAKISQDHRDSQADNTVLNSALRKIANNNAKALTSDERALLAKISQDHRDSQADNTVLNSALRKIANNNAKALTSDERALLAKISQDHRDSQTDNTVLNSALRKIANNNAKALTSDERALLAKISQDHRDSQADNTVLNSALRKIANNNAKALTSDERALLAKISQDHRDSQTDNTVLNSALRKIANNNAKALTSDERAIIAKSVQMKAEKNNDDLKNINITINMNTPNNLSNNASNDVVIDKKELTIESIIAENEGIKVTNNEKNVSAEANRDKRVIEKSFSLNTDILFDYNKFSLKIVGMIALDNLVNSLNEINPTTSYVEITGHTDRIGSQNYNKELSRKRAMSVMKYLVNQGVSSKLIDITAAGKLYSVTGNKCNNLSGDKLKQCLAPDRRVEIDIVAKKSEAK